MQRLRLKNFRTMLLLAGCLAFLCGVGIARGGYLLDASYALLASCLGIFAVRKKNASTFVWIVACGLCLGWWRGSLYMQHLAGWQHYYGQKVSLTAVALNDGAYGTNTQMSFDAGHVVINGRALVGKMTLSGFGANAVYQGDTVEAAGKLYATFGANQARMSFAELVITSHHSSLVATVRRKFAAGMQNALPEPLASFAMGLLIGQRVNLDAGVKQDLLMVGLTHIIAVSGYNLTIILRASKGVLGKRSKRLSTFFSLALIGVFLLFAGSSASIVRAAIVSLLSIGAGYYGRQVKPLLLIALAAAITAFANPYYVWTDTSWYLSFLAFYGVMVLAPMVAARLRVKWQNSLVAMVALESLCAEIMTLPFVLHTFGQMSFIGLLANVLVVALVPLAMLLGFAAGLAGMLASPVAGWFAWPARVLLTYMLDIAHILSRIPHIFVQNLSLPVGEMIALYGVVMAVTLLLWSKTKRLKSDTITEKN